MCKDRRALGGVPVTWEMFKTAILERFFPRDMRETKVEEFINLKQGSMKVREYYLKFVKLFRYATSLVSNNTDEMSRFLTGHSKDLDEECREAMRHDSMDLSRIMVHVQQVEESRKRKHTRAGNRSRQAEENFSRRSTTEIKDKPKFKKGLSHQGE
ncbi:uncharacterized protein LOC107001289 [Solanum pennellii]|uniref:Uncharacterized protein LOC107001289 n=1 Tax=Solanum pennellii TaxID=28526 RepID=A0ABM1FCG4_SOLPN|nr:uncharacterized protein LOC107001289 [Solanum pennellii]